MVTERHPFQEATRGIALLVGLALGVGVVATVVATVALLVVG